MRKAGRRGEGVKSQIGDGGAPPPHHGSLESG